MFCSNCGKQIPDNASFCDECKGKMETPAVEEATPAATEAPIAEEIPTTPFEEPVFTEEKPKKAKKKVGRGLIFGILGGVLALVVAAVVLFFVSPFFKGYFIKLFGNEAEYFSFVEKKAMNETIDDISKRYGKAIGGLGGEVATDVNVKLNLSEEFLDLQEYMPEQFAGSLDSFKDFEASLKLALRDSLLYFDVDCKNEGKKLLALEAFLDMAEYKLYVGADGSFNMINVASIVKDLTGTDITEQGVELDSAALAKVFPNEEAFKNILTSCYEVVLDNIGTVKMSDKKFEIEGMSKKLTILEKKVTEKDLVKIEKALLNEIKDNEDIKKFINDLEAYFISEGVAEGEKGSTYESFCKSVDEALESLDSATPTSGGGFSLISYVDGSHNIVGRAIKVDKEIKFEYITLEKGDKFAYKAILGEAVITGKGTKNGEAITGEYKLVFETEDEEKELLTFSLKDFSAEETLSGSITATPSEEMIKNVSKNLLGIQNTEVVALLKPEFKVTFGKDKTEIAIIGAGEELATLVITEKKFENPPTKLPDRYTDITEQIKNIAAVILNGAMGGTAAGDVNNNEYYGDSYYEETTSSANDNVYYEPENSTSSREESIYYDDVIANNSDAASSSAQAESVSPDNSYYW